VTISKREKYYAFGAGGAVILLLLYWFVVEPYYDALDEVTTQRQALKAQLNDADDLFARQAHLMRVWTDLKRGGVSLNVSAAQDQARHAILQWAYWAGIDITSLKTEHPTQQGAFQVIAFDLSTSGNTLQTARLLWAIETATIPMRVNDVSLKSRTEAHDTLSITIKVSALCQAETANANSNAANSAGTGS